MPGDLSQRFAAARELEREKGFLEARLSIAEQQVRWRADELARLDAKLRDEEDDVRRLDGLSVAGMFATLLGRKTERLAKEKAEVLRAKLARDACDDALIALRTDRDALAARITEIGDVAARLDALRAEKAEALRRGGSPAASRLDSIDAALAEGRATLREIGEAVSAADEALAVLGRVRDILSSAANFGAWDMVGGGGVVSFVKHGKLDAARKGVQEAQRALDRLARELADVREAKGSELVVRIDDFARFADVFFDGLLIDWFVQSKIEQSRKNVHATLERVGDVRRRLDAQRAAIGTEVEGLSAQRIRVVEGA